jgi:hypothetical protein
VDNPYAQRATIPPDQPGSLIVFEGPDGVGKTTLAGLYVEHIRRAGRVASSISFPGRSPGSLGSLVYDLHHHLANFGVAQITPEALQALHLAAHLDSIDRLIRPRVERGEVVVLDRFWWSMWVYGLGAAARRETIDALIECERRHWGTLLPTAVLLITRHGPLRLGDLGDTWTERLNLYRVLADRERSRYPVATITNDASPADALASAVRAIDALSVKAQLTSDAPD